MLSSPIFKSLCMLLLITGVVAASPLVWRLVAKPHASSGSSPVVGIELAKVVSNATDGSAVIVDVRSNDETGVSMIPNSVTQKAFEQDSDRYRGRKVIVYCTVGVRSQRYANQLVASGWDASNYEGGIIDWCQHQQPLMTPSGTATKQVHTYSADYQVPVEYRAVN